MTKQMQQNLIAIVMFLVMISFAYANYLIKPLNKKTMDTTNKLESIEDRLETMRRRARELPKLEKEMKVLQEEVASLEKLLPREKNIEEILNVISKTAQKYDVVINNITPGKLVPKNNYNEIPFKITAIPILTILSMWKEFGLPVELKRSHPIIPPT